MDKLISFTRSFFHSAHHTRCVLIATLSLMALLLTLAPTALASDTTSGQTRVTLCHAPPGNPSNAMEKYISQSAADAHLANHPDDRMGNCERACYSDAECSDGNSCTIDRCVNNRCDRSESFLGDGEIVEKIIPMRYLALPNNGEPVEPSFQWTRASEKGVHMIVETDHLREENTYTMWLGFFNDPDQCTNTPEQPDGLRCGLNNVWFGSFVYADGFTVTGTRDRFEVCWPVNEVPEGHMIQSGDGLLTNPLGAEYQSVLRFHGPQDARYMPEQVETHDGGCKGTTGQGAPPTPTEGYSCGTSQATGAATQIPIECTEFPDLEHCPPI